jgi:hypothetical protein
MKTNVIIFFYFLTFVAWNVLPYNGKIKYCCYEEDFFID